MVCNAMKLQWGKTQLMRPHPYPQDLHFAPYQPCKRARGGGGGALPAATAPQTKHPPPNLVTTNMN